MVFTTRDELHVQINERDLGSYGALMDFDHEAIRTSPSTCRLSSKCCSMQAAYQRNAPM